MEPAPTTESLNSTMEALQTWLATEGLAFGIRLLGALAIFVIGKWAAKLVSGLLSRALERAKLDPTLNRFLTRIATLCSSSS
ncbi:MAG: mechanosensitive ion channel family protein [Cephaloticoccus sp.]